MACVTIDCDYVYPQFAGAYLVHADGRGYFVENNTAHAVPRLLQACQTSGVSPDAVDFLIITHVHLDHAGGTSTLLAHCPNATVLAHPRAARHLVDPSRLVGSARQVYGDAVFEKLYGRVDPIPAPRVREMTDGERLTWQGRELCFWHTRGHANHHFVVHDEKEDAVFTGDAFGIMYPALQKHGLFIFPSTSPTDFDAEAAREAVRKIVGLGARTALLTHFGGLTAQREAADQLIGHLDFSEGLMLEAEKSGRSDEELTAFCREKLQTHFVTTWEATRPAMSGAESTLLKLDLDLNAAGLAYAAVKRRQR
ncbi:MAG: MBL fold metallo-hydrolase [Bacteriovoracia bacterium]